MKTANRSCWILATALLFFLLPARAQRIDHWETVLYADEVWRYLPGTSEPPADWILPSFNDGAWLSGRGGIGYGDGDDNTVIAPTLSLYMRREFTLVDLDKIARAVLHADFDDAFVAYLNGVEIARANIGVPGDRPAHNQPAGELREATLYTGARPEAYVLPAAQVQQLLKTGPNTLAVQVHNQSMNSSDLSSLFFFSVGLTDTVTRYGMPPAWFFVPESFESSPLPLLIINTNGQEIPDEPRVVAELSVIDNGPGQRNFLTDAPVDRGRIAIEIRGSSSQIFPKKNFGFETQDAAGENRNVALLGMPPENDWVLHGPYSDKSLMRNVLSYHLGRLTGRYAPRTRFCELVINGNYWGVYVLTERIKRDRNRVDIANLRPADISGDELTGGYIVQIDRDRPNVDDGWRSAYDPNPFYAYDDPDYDVLAPQQKAYIKAYFDRFEQNMYHPNFVQYYQEFVDVPSLVDYWIVTEITKQIDAYRLSFFMYKEKDSDGGKLHFGPLWDINLGYGNWDYGCSNQPEGWAYRFAADCGIPLPFWMERLMKIPAIRDAVACRWRELRQTVFQTPAILQYIDSTTVALDEAQQRNFARWPVLGEYVWPNGFVGQTYREEVDFLKTWIDRRLAWMDANMIGACTLTAGTPVSGTEPAIMGWPNPVQENLFLSWQPALPAEGRLLLYDALGRPVLAQPLAQGSQSAGVDMKPLPAGVYFYRLVVGGEMRFSGKIIRRE